jgi:hypothetical protein
VKDAPQGRLIVTTEYRDDPAMGFLVPAEMRESLEWHAEHAQTRPIVPLEEPSRDVSPVGPAGVTVRVDGSIEGRAEYSAFRSLAPVAGR